MPIRDDVKETLGVIEPLQRKLSEADQAWHEIDTVGGVLSARKDELAETEAQLQRTKAATKKATATLDQLNQTSAQEEKRIAARIDRLKAEMADLEKLVIEKRSELDSLTAGIKTLYGRLSGSGVSVGQS